MEYSIICLCDAECEWSLVCLAYLAGPGEAQQSAPFDGVPLSNLLDLKIDHMVSTDLVLCPWCCAFGVCLGWV